MHDQVLLSHELLSAMRTDKVLDALVDLFVIEKRRDEPVALTADVTNVKVCLLHVLPHVNLIEGKLITKTAKTLIAVKNSHHL